MKTCLFGGTFDPIHNAHLTIASEAANAFSLDRILFIPSANPPHKDEKSVTAYEDRFRMVEIACAGDPKFEASRLEAGAERSYTVETVARFKEQSGQKGTIYFLIGSDAFDELNTWKRWQELLELTDFIVVSRPGTQYHVPAGARVLRLDHLALPISSSSIRNRLSQGEATPELPTEVRAYIEEHGLYGWAENQTTSTP